VGQSDGRCAGAAGNDFAASRLEAIGGEVRGSSGRCSSPTSVRVFDSAEWNGWEGLVSAMGDVVYTVFSNGLALVRIISSVALTLGANGLCAGSWFQQLSINSQISFVKCGAS
jgi:hypothetical protein